MNEILKAIRDRNSCRDFSPEPLEASQITELVNAALAAPSAMNLQPWHIIVLTEKQLIEELDAEIMEYIKHDAEWHKRFMDRGGTVFYDAPCIIFIAQDGSDAAPLDCGIVSQNIALAAHSLGLGSVICGMARYSLIGEKGADFTRRLKFPQGYTFGMSVCVGKVNTGKAPHELDTNKVTYIG
ncbi:MAG: nitroreductase family protein [Defluviitaleaceae bacterium]|nr:nitroreductase family protein [Defluviitaleaceae bacterium]